MNTFTTFLTGVIALFSTLWVSHPQVSKVQEEIATTTIQVQSSLAHVIESSSTPVVVTSSANFSNEKLNEYVGTVSSSTIQNWNSYTNIKLGLIMDYPSNYGIPSLGENQGRPGVNFCKKDINNDTVGCRIVSSRGVYRDSKDGHFKTIENYFEDVDGVPSKPFSVNGKKAVSYHFEQDGSYTLVSLGNNEIFSITLNPSLPVDKKILSTIKFIPRDPQKDKFKLRGSAQLLSSYEGTFTSFEIVMSDLELNAWSGFWTLQLECPVGVKVRDDLSGKFDFGCNKLNKQEQWSLGANTVLVNTTNESKDVKVAASLTDNKGNATVIDEQIIKIQPTSDLLLKR